MEISNGIQKGVNKMDKQDNGVNTFALAAMSSLLAMPNAMFDEPRERKMKEKWENEKEEEGSETTTTMTTNEQREEREHQSKERKASAQLLLLKAYKEAAGNIKNAKFQRLYQKMAKEVR